MILNDLHKKYSSIKEIKLIGKEVVIGDKLGGIMGFYLYEKTLQLLLLEYDEKLIEYERQQENQRLKIENKLLKKATAIFAKEQ